MDYPSPRSWLCPFSRSYRFLQIGARPRCIAYILITESFLHRVQQAEEYNERLANGEIGPGIKGVWWSITGKRETKEREWREKTGKRKASLVWAMNDSVKWWFWSGGALKVVGDTAQVTSPLVVKVCWLCFPSM